MICKSCDKEYEDTYNYCPNCSLKNPLHSLKFSNEVKNYVDHSFNGSNIMNGNNNISSVQNGDNYYTSNEPKLPIIEYKYQRSSKIPFGVNGIKAVSILTGMLSFVSAIMTILTYFEQYKEEFIFNSSNFVLFTIIWLCITLFFLYSFMKLKNKKNVKILDKPFFELKEDVVYYVKKYSHCLICDGRVNIKRDKTSGKDIGICEKNHEHMYSYDETVNKGVLLEKIDFKFIK